MKIRSITHKGLRRLYEEDSAKGVTPDAADKLRKMLGFIDAMRAPEELRALPAWKAHVLTGDRRGTWSLHVTRKLAANFQDCRRRDHPAESRGLPLEGSTP